MNNYQVTKDNMIYNNRLDLKLNLHDCANLLNNLSLQNQHIKKSNQVLEFEQKQFNDLKNLCDDYNIPLSVLYNLVEESILNSIKNNNSKEDEYDKNKLKEKIFLLNGDEQIENINRKLMKDILKHRHHLLNNDFNTFKNEIGPRRFKYVLTLLKYDNEYLKLLSKKNIL